MSTDLKYRPQFVLTVIKTDNIHGIFEYYYDSQIFKIINHKKWLVMIIDEKLLIAGKLN